MNLPTLGNVVRDPLRRPAALRASVNPLDDCDWIKCGFAIYNCYDKCEGADNVGECVVSCLGPLYESCKDCITT